MLPRLPALDTLPSDVCSAEACLSLRLKEQPVVEVGVADWEGLPVVTWIVGDIVQLEIAVSQTLLSLYDDGGESARSLV
jgi:hypothetical protein